MKKNINHFRIVILSLVLLVVFLSVTYFLFYETEEEFHIHLDFKVYVDDEFYNFSDDRFMSVQGDYLHQFVHLHDNDGEVIHFHAREYNLVDFLDALNVSYNNTCFDGQCFDSSFKLYVNSDLTSIETYIPKDLDRVLIVYSNLDYDVNNLFNSVTDRACIQSGKCPERGDPFDESSCGPDSCIISLS